jgi:hypothetical protein
MIKLTESADYKVVQVQEITSAQKKALTKLQGMFKVIHGFFSEKSKSRAGYILLKTELAPYLKLPFAKPIVNVIKSMDKELGTIFSARKGLDKNLKSFNSKVDKFISLLKSGNVDAFIKMSKQMAPLNQAISKARTSTESTVSQIRNPFGKESNWLIQSTGLLKNFDLVDMNTLINKDLSKFKYSYLNFPSKHMNDFEYLVIFAQKLRDSKEEVGIDQQEFNMFTDFLYQAKGDWKDLRKLVDDYLHSNNKKLISKILKELDNFPELKQMNDKQKKKLKTVYRGVGGEGEYATSKDIKSILAQEKKNKFVATSKFASSAENFAQQKGHLMGGRNNNWGLLITYKVNSASIILDTEIFGSIFGESEVLIDTMKAKVHTYEEV